MKLFHVFPQICLSNGIKIALAWFDLHRILFESSFDNVSLFYSNVTKMKYMYEDASLQFWFQRMILTQNGWFNLFPLLVLLLPNVVDQSIIVLYICQEKLSTNFTKVLKSSSAALQLPLSRGHDSIHDDMNMSAMITWSRGVHSHDPKYHTMNNSSS